MRGWPKAGQMERVPLASFMTFDSPCRGELVVTVLEDEGWSAFTEGAFRAGCVIVIIDRDGLAVRAFRKIGTGGAGRAS